MKAKSSTLTSLIDIVILLAAVSGVEAFFNNVVPFQPDIRAELLINTLSKLPVLIVIWLLLRWRGETSTALGLQRPPSWPRAVSLGIVTGLGIFIVVWLLERAGFRRDLSAFNFVQGKIDMTIYQCVYVMVAAGFYEEVLYRGFYFQRIAVVFGNSRAGWVIAAIVQAAWFGYGHAYQNPNGVVLTGAIGLTLAIVFLNCGRNLWVPIIAHGFYDVARTVLFYFTGPPA